MGSSWPLLDLEDSFGADGILSPKVLCWSPVLSMPGLLVGMHCLHSFFMPPWSSRSERTVVDGEVECFLFCLY